jgi:gliding motility-associated GldL-like protein
MFTDKILNTAYSFAAGIVVFGAWAKLEHKEFGSTALTIGLLVESGIFIIYGLMEWRTHKSSGQIPDQHPAPQAKIADPQPRTDPQDLTRTMEHTNRILTKIFKVE